MDIKKCGRVVYYQRKGIAKRPKTDNETTARTHPYSGGEDISSSIHHHYDRGTCIPYLLFRS